MLNVGFVEYINAFPLTAAFLQGSIKTESNLFFNVPAQLNSLLRTGQIDLGLVSSAEFLDGQKENSDYVLLPGFGIYAQERILSVNLYIKKHITDLNNARVGLTSQSATSISLLKVLCQHFWKIKPNFEILPNQAHFEDYEGFLLIGDDALKNINVSGFKTIDLAQVWYYATGLPFIFAVFAIRKDALIQKQSQINEFQKLISSSLAWAEQNMAFIEEMAYKKCSLQKNMISDYYRICKYRLGAHEMRGLELFANLRKNLVENDV